MNRRLTAGVPMLQHRASGIYISEVTSEKPYRLKECDVRAINFLIDKIGFWLIFIYEANLSAACYTKPHGSGPQDV